MRSARGLALLCGFLKNDDWVLTLSWGSKRIDTKVSILLGLQFPLFHSLAKIRERRPLRKGERQRIFSTAGEHSVLPCRNPYTVSDTVLLHIRLNQRRCDRTVSHNSFARCYGRHLRIVSDVRLYRRVRRLGAPYQTTCTRVTVGAVIGRPRNRKSSRQFSILHYSTA